jgi:hypothetical protein
MRDLLNTLDANRRQARGFRLLEPATKGDPMR